MLVLMRKERESIYIGDNIKITVVAIKGNRVSIAIEAPKEVAILREEVRRADIKEIATLFNANADKDTE